MQGLKELRESEKKKNDWRVQSWIRKNQPVYETEIKQHGVKVDLSIEFGVMNWWNIWMITSISSMKWEVVMSAERVSVMAQVSEEWIGLE